MDYSSIIQELLLEDDTVVSSHAQHVVECSLESYKILALVEHSNWESDRIQKNYRRHQKTGGGGNLSPDSREFVIFVLNGRAPVRSTGDVDLVKVIPVGNSFSCDLDTEGCVVGDSDVCVKISSGSAEQPQLYRLACGNLSQNFIDEVFRAISYASKQTSSGTFPWLAPYERLVMDNTSQQVNPFLIEENDFLSSGNSRSDEALDKSSDDEQENMAPGITVPEGLPSSISSVQGREVMVRSILDTKKDAYTDLKAYKVLIATWNVNGQSPGSICLRDWLSRTPEPADVVAVGFQELDLSTEAFLFADSPREKEWLHAVKMGLHPQAKYRKLKLVRLVGMMLIIFVKEELHKSIHRLTAENVGTGLLGKMGNKGGVAVRFDLEETSMCFVNCHLAAHVEEYQRRNQDYSQILSRMIFTVSGSPRHILEHDQIFWFGDMNYRINPASLDADRAKVLIKAEKYSEVLKYDQLKDQLRERKVFQDFIEGPINFRPTYKYDVNTDNWDSSEKNRSPAWCDRVLYKGANLEQLDYTSTPQYKLSDHKPVSSLFETKVKVVNQSRYRKSYEDALKWLDKEENKCLPQVVVDIPGTSVLSHSNRNELHFETVRFLEPVTRSFHVRNVGKYTVKLEFIKKLNDNYVCKDWLTIEPLYAYIQPDESREIRLEVLVDKKSAGNLNIGRDSLYDILVLHLDGGKDIFVTVVGDYERSVFGCSITSLVNMTEPIRQVSPGKLIELEKGKMPLSHYDIPKELWFLVDRLYRTGMDKTLFSQSGLTSEILEIRNWLDEIPNTQMPGTTDSVAETLLILLDSFPEPVIPFSMHLRCMEVASSYSSCKELLRQLPAAHRNVFVYICSFLRELLLHANNNHLDPKVLAVLFGRVMLRDQNHHAKPNVRDERRKEGFVYQFLVNEDYATDF